ncbi:MAG: helix-turn-helix transcriptional regulator [Bacteroidaceae bacterium]|nr:helix-turn-helix transcriptional regulator [Bacteroidaceae bacterium]MBR0045807.1 helix-turn-helix transcriptional regulator [Bacteroidaceae bacterium]
MDRLNVSSIPRQMDVDYQDNSIVLLSDIKEMQENTPQAVLMENYLAVLVLKGHATIYVGNEEINVQAGDLFVCLPQNILKKSMFSMDLEVRGFCVSKEMVEELLHETSLYWSFRFKMLNHVVVHTTKEEMNMVNLYYTLLNEKLNAPESPYKSLSLRSLFSSLVYGMGDIFENNERSLLPTTHTSAEHIFELFINLIEDPQQPFTNVNGYAELLHITPKYFSSICKKLSGKTANEIIIEQIIKQAKILLHDNSLSIKQVADRLNFANQSHFGTYFHRYTGMSPQHFRQDCMIGKPIT